ncbi:hypothetical protein DQP55_21855, partial [Mycolicibacterium sp. GF69]
MQRVMSDLVASGGGLSRRRFLGATAAAGMVL